MCVAESSDTLVTAIIIAIIVTDRPLRYFRNYAMGKSKMSACACVCVRACVRACVRVCVY